VAIPDFQTLMLPLLEEYADGAERRIRDVRAELGRRFDVTQEERAARLPSGAAKTFDNRVGWATTYLHHAGLLDRAGHGVYVIADRGREVLAANPERIDLNYLSRFPEFVEFRKSGGAVPGDTGKPGPRDDEATPEERIEAAYQELRQALIAELQEKIAVMSPEAFEDLVLDVLYAMGYGDGTEDSRVRTGRSGDAGIDGLIREDRLGLDSVYVQAKRWQGTVGREVVQGFVGALQGARASKGIMFTASSFSRGAEEYASSVTPRVVLIDGQRLAGLMADHDVGVSNRETYVAVAVVARYTCPPPSGRDLAPRAPRMVRS
jgi:restriction system protein